MSTQHLAWLSDPTPFIRTEVNDIWDISFIKHYNTQLVFIAGADQGVFAYNCSTGELEWSVHNNKVKYHVGVTNDERGHLFHCIQINENRCVKMFAAKNGKDHVFLQVEKSNLNGPFRIRWCKKTSSLILADIRDEKWFISVITVKYPD